jgi:4'-phosphopantetheinyl transferase
MAKNRAELEFELLPQRAHVWTAIVTEHTPRYHDLWSLLDVTEQERARRFHFEKDRLQYVVAHGLLRVLLGQYLATAPAAVGFAAGAHGKPALAATTQIHFNLSHSGDVVAVALCLHHPIGVDVEQWRDIEYDELGASVFSLVERGALRTAPQKDAAFFACWTRKEAYIKATGLGISQGLESFDVTVLAGEPAQLLADRRTGHSSRDWTMSAIPVPPGYSGAVVVQGRTWTIEPRNLSAELIEILLPRAERL